LNIFFKDFIEVLRNFPFCSEKKSKKFLEKFYFIVSIIQKNLKNFNYKVIVEDQEEFYLF